MQRQFTEAQLENPVHHLGSGAAALAYFAGEGPFGDRQRHPLPSVLILDLNMPGISGFDVLHAIAQRPDLRRMLIVVLSGIRDLQSIKRAYELGANTYLVKPVGREDFKNVLEFFRGYWMFSANVGHLSPSGSVAQSSRERV